VPHTIASLGEIGEIGADGRSILRPLDLPLLRNGAAWNLTGYTNVAIEVWDQRTRAKIASPGTVAITAPETAGIVRWTPNADAFTTGAFEARLRLSSDSGTTWQPSGLFRFSIAGSAHL
jgi:hypothetical protein